MLSRSLSAGWKYLPALDGGGHGMMKTRPGLYSKGTKRHKLRQTLMVADVAKFKAAVKKHMKGAVREASPEWVSASTVAGDAAYDRAVRLSPREATSRYSAIARKRP